MRVARSGRILPRMARTCPFTDQVSGQSPEFFAQALDPAEFSTYPRYRTAKPDHKGPRRNRPTPHCGKGRYACDPTTFFGGWWE